MTLNITNLSTVLQQKIDAALVEDNQQQLLLLAKSIEALEPIFGFEAAIIKKQDILVSGTSIKTINNESILGTGNILTSTSVVKKAVISYGFIDYSTHFPDVDWSNTGTSSYSWLIQRTDNVAAGVGQFASVQGGYRSISAGGCKGTIIPFQINSAGALVAGTPATMWTNTLGFQDFSTCSCITDNKSGGFHYSGNIPWPGNTSHIMGYGYGLLNANNTASGFWDSGTDNLSGIHQRNGLLAGIPDADGSGWYGVNSGYANGDSRTRQHFCNFGSPSAPVITVINPSANTSTSPIALFLKNYNSTSANTAISGACLWQNASSQVVTRIFGFSETTYTDYIDTSASFSDGKALALSNGKVLVNFGSTTYAYTAHNARSLVSLSLPAFLRQSWSSYVERLLCIASDTWILPSIYGVPYGEIRFSKFVMNPSTYTMSYAGESESYAVPSNEFSSYFSYIYLLPNNRLLCFSKQSSGFASYIVLDMPTTWTI